MSTSYRDALPSSPSATLTLALSVHLLAAALASILALTAPRDARAQTGMSVGPWECACPGMVKPLGNHHNCEDACFGVRASPGGGSGDHSGAQEAGRAARRWFDCKLLGSGCPDQTSPAEQARQQRRSEALAANSRGVEFHKKGDLDRAVAFYQEAANKDPDDPIIRQNLVNAQQQLANARREQEMQQQARASASRMNQSIQEFAQSLNAAPLTGGLDFDGRNAGTAPGTGNSGRLDFASGIATTAPVEPASPLSLGDPRVVDARKVSSGLSKDVESAIAGAYANAPPGVSDRVRKGFQAVMDRDWKVAKAWFEDALSRDPSNAGLKRLVALAESTQQPSRQPATSTAVQTGALQLPDPNDIKLLFPAPHDRYGRLLPPDPDYEQIMIEIVIRETQRTLPDR